MDTFRARMGRGLRTCAGIALMAFVVIAAPGIAHAQAAPIGLRDPIQRVDLVNGGLVATTTQGQQVPIDVTAQQVNGPCPILNLHLGPIDLNLLGLDVQTSPICLEVTGVPGNGNLLGNLLCGVARLLDRGVTLGDVLARLSAAERTAVLNGIRDILNGILNQLNNAAVTSAATGQAAPAAACPILNLALGPLDLNLLGLHVHLDNCADGPVTVNVTAVPGAGNLLGNLLCGLLGSVNPGTTLSQLLQQVITAILGALG
jgi:hypothetical protein